MVPVTSCINSAQPRLGNDQVALVIRPNQSARLWNGNDKAAGGLRLGPGGRISPSMSNVPNTSTILVVDDEKVLRDLLRPYLEAEGFSVVEAATGPEALHALQRGGIDLVVLDVMLPGEDGFSVLRQAREFSDAPVIMLTARRDEDYRVLGLRQGADDYVVKPFSTAELVARIVANLRRARGDGHADILAIGEVTINLASRTASIAADVIDLTRREFDLLATLVQNQGRVLSRDQLLHLAWDTEHVTPKTVDVHIAMLRRKFGAALNISALRGVGYRLEPA